MTDVSSAAPSDVASGIARAARRQTRRIGIALVALNLALPLGTFLYTTLTGQSFWRAFRSNAAPSEWFSSMQCVLIAFLAYANHAVHVVLHRAGSRDLARHAWVWLVFAVGFVVLGLDERFDFHEALRDHVFRPAGLFIDLPYVASGEVGLYLFYGIGLVFSWLLLPELRRWKPAFVLFVAALALTLSVVVIDSLDDPAIRHWTFRTFWDYPFEETGEIWAQLLFALSFLVVLHGRLGHLAHLEELGERGGQGGA